jgi:hypothetical protein
MNQEPVNLCACGCGGITNRNPKGGHFRFRKGHGTRISGPMTSRVLSNCIMVKETGCLLFQGSPKSEYGSVCWSQTRERKPHRIVSSEAHGPIPCGMDVCHTCDTPRCCNLSHLWLGTRQENMDDKMEKGRHKATRGSKHPLAKLSEEDAVFIKNDPRPQRKIASQFGVSQRIVWNIKNGRAWNHVT